MILKMYQRKGVNTRKGKIKEKQEKEPSNYDNVCKQNWMNVHRKKKTTLLFLKYDGAKVLLEVYNKKRKEANRRNQIEC